MGKKLVMRQDTTYMPSAVYGFEWVEETLLQKAGTSKSGAVKRNFDSGILHPPHAAKLVYPEQGQ